MSRKRIKCLQNRKKNSKGSKVSMRHALQIPLQLERANRKEEENAEVIALITEEVLDIKQRYNYRHIANVARQLGWSVGRLQKATDRVAGLLKGEEQEKDNE